MNKIYKILKNVNHKNFNLNNPKLERDRKQPKDTYNMQNRRYNKNIKNSSRLWKIKKLKKSRKDHKHALRRR